MRSPPRIVGVVLAGGLSRRMGGGDKCLRPVGDRPLLQHVIDRMSDQVETLVLNANGVTARFRAFGIPVVADTMEEYAGPLAGVLAGMEWAVAMRPEATHVLSLPSDTPFLPPDLSARFIERAMEEGVDIVCAASGGRIHPTVGLWPVALQDDIHHALMEKGTRKVRAFLADYAVARVDWPVQPYDPFFNVNTPEDLRRAEAILAA